MGIEKLMYTPLDENKDISKDLEIGLAYRERDEQINSDIKKAYQTLESQRDLEKKDQLDFLWDQWEKGFLPIGVCSRFKREKGNFTYDEICAFENNERKNQIKELEDISKAYGLDGVLFSQFSDEILNKNFKDALNLDDEMLVYVGVHANSFEKLYMRAS